MPSPPMPRNRLAQEPPPGSAVEFSHNFFYQGIGFFMVLVDVGQLFRCVGHHFMCVATGPPIMGDPISHSQAHIPLKSLPPTFDPFPEATSPWQEPNQCVDIIWAKAARGVWGLAHVFNNKLFFTRDIMDDDAVPKHFNVPEPKPKPKPKPAPKPTAAPKPGPKGQHRQNSGWGITGRRVSRLSQ